LVGNIALTTLIVFMLAIPGYVARSFYHTAGLAKSILPKRVTDDLVGSLSFSIPIHVLAVILCESAFHYWEWVPYWLVPEDINFVVVFRLLSGDFGNDFDRMIVDNVYSQGLLIGRYALLVLMLSVLVGLTLRWAVWRFKLDLHLPFIFRFGNYWLYRTTGRGKFEKQVKELKKAKGWKKVAIWVALDALVEVEGKVQIYSGILKDFNVDENGEVIDLNLVKVNRITRKETMLAGQKKTTYYPDPIAGDMFVVRYSNVINLNLEYWAVEPSKGESVRLPLS